jgi:hypothetical protein
MASVRESFGADVLACVEDINRLLPDLNQRYHALVIVGALGEHIGSALQLLMRRNLCDANHAKLVLERIQGTAFLREQIPRKGSDSPPN